MDPESELFTQAIKAGAQLSRFDALDTRGKLGVFEKGNHNKAHSHWLKVYNLLLEMCRLSLDTCKQLQ